MDLVVFDTSAGTVISTDPSGMIQTFDFENLRMLYRIIPDEYVMRELAFSGDSHPLLNITGSLCRLCDFIVLVRDDMEDQNSNTLFMSTE